MSGAVLKNLPKVSLIFLSKASRHSLHKTFDGAQTGLPSPLQQHFSGFIILRLTFLIMYAAEPVDWRR
jgi:hypothetical protein